jgi:CRISPR-associated RAMP protein (TIGR02581 family)
MYNLFWHDRLISRHRIEGKLKVTSPLRISSGVAGDGTDAPFIRDAGNRPYVPGTCLRGSVRAALERALAGYGEVLSGLSTCTLFSEDDCAKAHREELMAAQEIEDEKKRNAAWAAVVETKICDLCRLFGNTMFASRIFFEDGFFCGAVPEPLIRDGVGIDRDSGAAAEGVKYDYEVIDPAASEGLFFCFVVTVENATFKDLKLLGLMLRLLIEGLHVGGKRAGGMGCIKLIDPVQVSGFDDPKAAWKSLQKGEPFMLPIVKPWKEVFPC